jgi:hypothetical protein
LLIAFELGILGRTARSRDKYWKKKKSLHERSILMLLSTLPDLSGRTYDVIGVVFGTSNMWAAKDSESVQRLGTMFNTITQQASSMGADAIVDIKMVAVGEGARVVVTGTAVKLR